MRRAALSGPLTLLMAVTALFTFLIQSGELGTSDTAHRLQVTHSLWTREPQVFPYEYPDFGVRGRDGRLYASYGIGQSLLMLPADLVGSAASHLPLWRNYAAKKSDPTVRSIVVSISTNILINLLTALAAHQLLVLLGFNLRQSIAGVLGLLCATTHLHYAQNLTENNYILLLTVAGFALQYRWLVRGDRRALLWGSVALGLNLLTRITTALDILGAACFLLLAMLFARYQPRSRMNREVGTGGILEDASVLARVSIYLRTALPIYAFFFFLDRMYQYIRFGSWTTTYVGVLTRQQRLMDPSLPSNFPFNGHWFQEGLNSGVIGPLFSPEKSIFLFDPMFPLALLLTVLLWRRLEPCVRAFLATWLLLVASYIAFYGGYYSWAGDAAWGDRYVSSAVELAALLGLPLLVRYRRCLGRPVYYLGLGVTVFSVAVQCASLAFWLPLEIDQMTTFGHPTWVVFLRFKNIAGFALGRWDRWGLNTPAIFRDPWDAAHLTTWNILPSLLRRIGDAPLWAVHVLYGVWWFVVLALIYGCTRLVRSLCRIDSAGTLFAVLVRFRVSGSKRRRCGVT
jgi:hypothetical protein